MIRTDCESSISPRENRAEVLARLSRLVNGRVVGGHVVRGHVGGGPLTTKAAVHTASTPFRSTTATSALAQPTRNQPFLEQFGLPHNSSMMLELVTDSGPFSGVSNAATFSACLCQTPSGTGERSSTDEHGSTNSKRFLITNPNVTYPNAINPSALAAWGIDLANMVFVTPRQPRDLLWACERAARCQGVDMVIAQLNRADATTLRRIKLATEIGGGLVVLWRPKSAERENTWADARLRLSPMPTLTSTTHSPPLIYQPRLCVDVLYQKGLTNERSYMLTWNNCHDPQPVVSQLADTTSHQRTQPDSPGTASASSTQRHSSQQTRRRGMRSHKARRRKTLARVG